MVTVVPRASATCRDAASAATTSDVLPPRRLTCESYLAPPRAVRVIEALDAIEASKCEIHERRPNAIETAENR
jgi:hypothetical protein